MIKKYRKKPVVIVAKQLSKGNIYECLEWINSNSKDRMAENYSSSIAKISIETLEGKMFCNEGDWIILGIAGEFYPCKNDIFQATYEEVNDE